MPKAAHSLQLHSSQPIYHSYSISTMISFENKTYIVTGGASGIGKALVHKLLAQSAQVHVIDLADKFPDEIPSTGKLWFYPGVDVSSREIVASTFKAIHERSTKLHGLVNCAAILALHSATADGADEVMNKVMAVNVTGTWNCCVEFYKYADKTGRVDGKDIPRDADTCIVNMSSQAGIKGYPGASAYVMSKHAVSGLTKTLAMEWAPSGIRVNALAPGAVQTPMMDEFIAGHKDVPGFKGLMRDVLEPDEIADAILYLLSPMSSGIVGNIVEIAAGK